MTKQIATGFFTLLIAASALAAKPGGAATREITYPGLPAITYMSDGDGLLSEVRMGGKPIVSYDWSQEPYDVPVRFFGQWSINTSVMPDGSGTQQVIDSLGTQRGAAVVLSHARQLGRPTILLDALAVDLGLPPEWQDGQEVTSANDVQLHANGNTINIKFHSVGQGIRVGESDGKAVLWDLDLPLGLKGLLGQIVPSRLIVTSSGIVHLSAESRTIGAIDGIWTNDAGGKGITVRKQLDTSATHTTITGARHIESTDSIAPSTDAPPTRDVHAEMRWMCGMFMYWVYWVDDTGVGHTETRYQATYCDSGDGGGVGGCSVGGLLPRSSSLRPVSALYCGGDDSGGGGGSGTTSNNQTVDILLHAAVDDGKLNAISKLQSAQFQSMIKMLKNAAGIPLWDVMSSYAAVPGTYVDSQITFVQGDGAYDIATNSVPCSVGDEIAWVSVPGVHTVDVCGSFKGLSTGIRGVTVIHEMLHTLGLP